MLITFIGGGNMATALISGLKRHARNDFRIRVSDPDEQARVRLQANYDVEPFTDPIAAINGADVIVIAVKPQFMALVLDQLSGATEPGQLVLSIAAGTTLETMSKALGEQQAIIRSMPIHLR